MQSVRAQTIIFGSLTLAFLLCLTGIPAAQTPGESDEPGKLQSGFRQIRLGMSFDEAAEALKKDTLFLYRGEPDVSLLAEENRSLIQSEGAGFLSRATFQFDQEILVTFTLELNRSRIDYFTMYSHLRDRYGEPDDLDPSRAVWSGDAVRLSLERPASVKYMDQDFYRKLREDREREETQEEGLREDFLDEF